MPFTQEFRNILLKNKRNFGVDLGYEKAFNEAASKGVLPFRDRKKKENRFNTQKGNENELIGIF